MEYERTRELTLPRALDNKQLFLTLVIGSNFSNAEQNCFEMICVDWTITKHK